MAVTELDNQVIATEGANDTQERTFTQDEVNAMVQNRISKERAKFSDYEQLKEKASRFDEIEEANKTELQKATERADELQSKLDQLTKATELNNIRNKVSTETGVPVSLLTADSEEACKAQAEAILSFAKPNGYPTVKDGGEPQRVETRSTSDQFADWLNDNFKK